jgi:RNA recognition motif-containing protein
MDPFKMIQWYYASTKTKTTEGPATLDDLRDLWDAGDIAEETLMWQAAFSEWVQLKMCGELLSRLKEEAPVHMIMPDDEELKEARAKKNDKKKKAKKKKVQEGPKEWFELKKNTSVYVQNLPLDVNVNQLMGVFKKAGIIKIDPISKQPKVKIYSDAAGNPKGDALVTYLKCESVDLAVKLLDETAFRDGDAEIIRVQPAKFQQKGDTYVPKDTTAIRQAARKAARLQDGLFSWHEVGDENPRVVILQHMFHPDDFAEEVNLKQELKEDMFEELGKLGTVEKVRIYDRHPEGVIWVQFADSLVASKCIEKMRGRWYNGARIIADLWDYKRDFKAESIPEDDAQRLALFEQHGLKRPPPDDDDSDDDDSQPPLKKAVPTPEPKDYAQASGDDSPDPHGSGNRAAAEGAYTGEPGAAAPAEKLEEIKCD